MFSKRTFKVLINFILLLVLCTGQVAAAPNNSSNEWDNRPGESSISTDLSSSPMMFIENVGQFDPPIGSEQGSGARFQVRGGNSTIWLAEDALWVTVLEQSSSTVGEDGFSLPLSFGSEGESSQRRGVNIRLSFPGANPAPSLEPFDRLETSVNYFIGSDPAKWQSDVPAWGGVRYKDLYPGIDLEISGENGQLVQRLLVREGADLGRVRLHVEGADEMVLDGEYLRLLTTVGEYSLPLLLVNSANNTKQASPSVIGKEVSSPFGKPQTETTAVHPLAGASDLLYASFLGGSSSDYGTAIAVDASGSAYATGYTTSSDFPTTPGPFDTTYNGTNDVFVTKLNVAGNGLTYSTFLGGSGNDYGYGITVDSSGAAYVTGYTYSSNYPTTPGAFDTTFTSSDAFVTKLDAAGSGLAYSTFLGGSSAEYGYAVAVDSSGATYVTGWTNSSNFPTTPGAYDTTFNGVSDAFVVKLNAAGSELVYSTFLGGNDSDYGKAIAMDSSGAAYITSETYSSNFPTTPGVFDTTHNGLGDAFATKLNAAGSGLVYSTFLGGSNSDRGYAIAVDSNGAAYIAGSTVSTDFPTTPGALETTYNGGTYDAFVVKLNAAGSGLAYATFLGGSNSDKGYAIAVDSSEEAYVTGLTASSDFPTTPEAFDTTYNGGEDAFVTKLNVDGSQLAYSTFLGGSSNDYGNAIAVNASGAAYVTGSTVSSDFPTTPGAFDPAQNGGDNSFVAKLTMGNVVTTYSISGLVTDGSSNLIPDVSISDGAGHTTTTDSNGNYILSGLAVGTYTITPSKSGYTFLPVSRPVTVPPDSTGQNFVMVVSVDIGFRPATDGYGFANYGEVNLNDYTVNDMRRMFGDDAVCQMTDSVCSPRFSAQQWLENANQSMDGGHCDGMASTSLRFFKNLDNLVGFQSEASITHDLLRDNIRQHIAYYFVEQLTDPVRSYKETVRQNTPVEILGQLYSAMSNGAQDPTTLFVRQTGEGGHAITPYAIEDKGNGVSWVRVYDNNYPDDANRYVVINTTNNTWSYDLDGTTTWSGDANTKSLGIVPISQYAELPVCPWCSDNGVGTQGASTSSEVRLNGGGHLLITDSLGQRLGYDGNQLVSEIPGAYASAIDAGVGIELEPIYVLPLTETYTILLDGQALTQTETTAIAQFGPGYAVSVDDILLGPTSRDELTFTSDGTDLSYQASEGKRVTLTLALENANESYQFQVKGADIGAGQIVTAAVETSTTQLVFNNAQAGGGEYDLNIRCTNMAGEQSFDHFGVVISATDTHFMDYGCTSGPISLHIDHGSDGTIDETVVLENQVLIYLPLVLR